MERINQRNTSQIWHHDRFYQTLATQVAVIYCWQTLEENQIGIRFENGYGVTILPVSQEEEFFELLVLRFYGTQSNDYQVAQYAPIPELNRGDFNEIIDLCKQVAFLPTSKPRPDYSGLDKANVKHKKLARRCSNFL